MSLNRTLEARIRTGRSTVVIGGMPDLPPGVVALRVSCDLTGTRGVFDRARATVEGALDHCAPARWPDTERGAPSAHRRLLAGDDRWRRAEVAFVEACNLLAAQANGRVVLVLDGIDAADEETHRALAAILRDRSRLRLPLLLVTHRDPTGSMLEILEALRSESDAATFAGPPRTTESSLPSSRREPTLPEDLVRTPTAALEQRLDAIARMTDAGEVGRAAKTLADTSTAISGITAAGARAVLEARLRLERARLLWLATGEEGTGTLFEAWTEALAAWHAIPGKGPASLRAYAAATLASIAYEIGGDGVLDLAREILADTIGALLQEGASTDAASLINEQAALELRRDRVGAAAALLARSRQLFEARVMETRGEAASRAELADTDLLLARLPLHAWASSSADRAFLGDDGLRSALASGHAAERTYRALGMRRELARACDVLGRLEARRGDAARARPWFDEALAVAEELGDAGALARTTAALAELLAEAGQPEQALGLLRSSISVNREKGSTIGLSFDAAALDVIENAVTRMGGAVASAMRRELAQARAGLDDGAGPITSRSS